MFNWTFLDLLTGWPVGEPRKCVANNRLRARYLDDRRSASQWACASLGVVFLLVLSVHSAYAIDLSWQPQLRIGTRATDNLRSAVDNQEAAWGFDTGGGVAFKAESSNWRSNITPAFNFRRFVIGEDSDADEYNVRSQHQWAFTERAVASLNADYIRDSTLSTELSDTGRNNTAINRDTVMLNPGVSYALNERTSVNAGFLYSDVNFQQRPGSGFVDYDYKQATFGSSHVYNEIFTFFATGYVSEFRTPDIGGKSLTYGGQGGVTYYYSDTLDGDFAVGYTQSEIDSLTQVSNGFQFIGFDPVTGAPIFAPIVTLVKDESTTSGPIASASIRKKFERLRARLDYNRAISPSSRGAQTIADDILFTLDHDLSRRLLVGFRGSYNMRSTETDVLAGDFRGLNRDQTMVGAVVSYKFTKEIAVAANYRFFWNQLQDPSRSIYNNTLFVTLNYGGEPHYYRGN